MTAAERYAIGVVRSTPAGTRLDWCGVLHCHKRGAAYATRFYTTPGAALAGGYRLREFLVAWRLRGGLAVQLRACREVAR